MTFVLNNPTKEDTWNLDQVRVALFVEVTRSYSQLCLTPSRTRPRHKPLTHSLCRYCK